MVTVMGARPHIRPNSAANKTALTLNSGHHLRSVAFDANEHGNTIMSKLLLYRVNHAWRSNHAWLGTFDLAPEANGLPENLKLDTPYHR